jgi:MFS family permease
MNERNRFGLSSFSLLCGIGLLAIFSSTISKSPVLPLFAQSLGAPEDIIGLIAAASTIVGILVGLPAGALSDIFGRKRIMLFALFIFATAPIPYLFVTQGWQLVAVRMYHGIATAVFGPVAMALVADQFKTQRGARMGLYSSSTLVGRSIAPFVGGALLSLFAASLLLHYRIVYIVCAVAGILAFAAAFALPADAASSREQGKASGPSMSERFATMMAGLKDVLTHRGILVTSATEAVQYFGYGAYEVFLPLYAKTLGMQDWLIGILLGAKVLVLTFSKPLMGKISDQSGRRGQIVLGMVAGAIGLGLIPVFHSFWSLLVLSLFLGLSMSMVTSSTSALVADLSKGAHGAAMGAMHTIMDVGHASGPIVVGFLIVRFGYGTGYFVVGVMFALAALVFPMLVSRKAIEGGGEAPPR